MKIFACFPSKYLKAADLHDKHVQAAMSHVLLEELQNKDGIELCPILYFNGVQKGMVLNKTNAKAISVAYGDETEMWKGMPIILFPAMVAFGAETVEAIRVKLPSAAERIRSINESTHKEALGEHMLEQRLERPINAAWVSPATTEADMARAKEIFATRKPTPRPKVMPINEAMALHAADGIIWDEAAERLPTEEERAEILRDSLQRANAAMEARRATRGATKPDDGLDIPTAFDRRPRPPEPDYGPNSWIEHMRAAE